MEIEGKKIIITGGVRGLGRCLAEKLCAAGAKVAVFDSNLEGIAELEQSQPEIAGFACDISDDGWVDQTLSEYLAQFGTPHVLVNNAGILHSEPLVRLTSNGLQLHGRATWDKVLGVNLNAVFYMTSRVVAKMIATRTKGVIVNISSVAGRGNAGQTAYSAAKAAVNALTVTWAKELGSMGIRVVAVAPGFTKTESTVEVLSEANLEDIIKKVPLRRLGLPEEIAEGVISCIRNDFFNGKVFELDGGIVL